jgi:hypothetical protein
VSIVSHPTNKNYRDNFDATFEKKEPTKICGLTYCSDGNAGGHAGAEFTTCGRPFDHEGPRGDIPGTKCGRGPT